MAFSQTQRFSPYLLLAPFFLCLTLFWLMPLISGINLSFQSNTVYGESEFVGVKHYSDLLSDKRYFRALTNNIIYTCCSVALILPLSLALAHLIQSAFSRLRPFFTFALLLPGITPPAVLALLFLLVFHGKEGMLNQWFIIPLGLKSINWIKDPDYIMPALILQTVWRWTGFITFFLLAGMEGIPRSLYEASALATKSRWQQFRFITLPMLRNVILFCGIYLVIDAFSLFSGAYMLLGGSGGTLDAGLLLISYSYENFRLGQPATAATISSSVAPILLLILWFTFIRTRKTTQ